MIGRNRDVIGRSRDVGGGGGERVTFTGNGWEGRREERSELEEKKGIERERTKD